MPSTSLIKHGTLIGCMSVCTKIKNGSTKLHKTCTD